MDARWWQRSGPWLAVGTSPAALVLGARLAGEHGPPVTLTTLLIGTAAMASVLLPQARLAVEGGFRGGLSGLRHAYFTRSGRAVLSVLVVAAMIGWFGFNVAVGGAALAELLALPAWLTIVVFAGLIVALASLDITRWNLAAVASAAMTLVLCAALARQFTAYPVSTAGLATTSVDGVIGAFLGYVIAFAVRVPDFTTGLARTSDAYKNVAVLVVATIAVVAAGSMFATATGSDDIIATLRARADGQTVQWLLALATVAPALAALHSGRLAVRERDPRSLVATLSVAAPGVILAVTRLDRAVVPWLQVLATGLGPAIFPLLVAHHLHRRGTGHRAPVWSWVPASVAGTLATARGYDGVLLSLALGAVLTATWWLSVSRVTSRRATDAG